MSEITLIENEGVLLVDSRLVASRLGIEHRSFMATINNYQSQTEQDFGVLRFEIAKLEERSKEGRPQRYALLTEDQAVFLMTLSRNTPDVLRSKADLVKAFSEARRLLERRGQAGNGHQAPYWYQRLTLAMTDLNRPLPTGYFCAYARTMEFFAVLEGKLQYIIPDISLETNQRLIPDISVGKAFNTFLRSDEEIPCRIRRDFLGSDRSVDFREGGSHYHEIRLYNHVYPTTSHGHNNIQACNAYPISYSSIFDYYLQEWWIPDKCVRYLRERDPEGLERLQKELGELIVSHPTAIAGTLLHKLLPSLPSS